MAASTDVTPIAALAKLAISDQSYLQVKENFESTLKLFEELTQVDTTGIAPLVSPGDRHQTLRADTNETLVERAELM
ncbi:MAG: Asp-tRNA(Asn)/Glu-tRNA(Gln) amidotransferase subunit GatC, partial [Luminiphilus sp.]|nr:Asp-tRNA(Asn)/Glu-tRNA(Gln) amidotransferase subunit GatC [Luminiphilus sp.]